MLKYKPGTYGQVISLWLQNSGRLFIRVKPKWWRRLLLGEKVQTYAIDDICKSLADSAKEVEEQLLRSIFNDGKANPTN